MKKLFLMTSAAGLLSIWLCGCAYFAIVDSPDNIEVNVSDSLQKKESSSQEVVSENANEGNSGDAETPVSEKDDIETVDENGNSVSAGGSKPEKGTDPSDEETSDSKEYKEKEVFQWNTDWEYAEYSAIHDDDVTLYYALPERAKGIVVCVNAGHGTSGGSSQTTLCHPDGTPKVTGGSTSAGSKRATAIAEGTTMLDGTPEAEVTLKLAQSVKEVLLDSGYHVLMIRENSDTQLDNIARTVFANHLADCHIALHYDSSENNKGAFYISVPNSDSYRSMEPVASHWKSHNALGAALVEGLRGQGRKIFGEGSIGLDLTQTSYSTIPSVDLELGDRASDYSEDSLKEIAKGIADGLKKYFEQ